MQKMPMPICTCRQPTSAMKCWMIGGQTTPERELPIVAKEMARPRCRSNHSEASATNGAKLAALPRPMVRPETTANAGRVGSASSEDVAERHEDRAPGQRWQDAEAVRQPADRDAADHEADHSERVGQEAPARCTPKSACTAGSATAKDHRPTQPSVLRVIKTRRRTRNTTSRWRAISVGTARVLWRGGESCPSVGTGFASDKAGFLLCRASSPRCILATHTPRSPP